MERAANLPGRLGHARAASGPVNRDVALFANAAVDAEVEIGLHSPRTPDDEAVSIFFGKERITLEFYDVESLERLVWPARTRWGWVASGRPSCPAA
jgi:hypothetical protein